MCHDRVLWRRRDACWPTIPRVKTRIGTVGIPNPQIFGCAVLRGWAPHGRSCAPPPVCLSVCRCLSATPGRRRLCRRRRTDRKKDGQVRPRRPAAPPTPHITCSKNPAFSHIAYGGKVCYNNPVFAARGSGPCGTWCISTPDWYKGDPSAKTCRTLRRASSTPRLTTRQRWRARDLSMRCERPHDETPFRQISQTSTRKLQAGRRGGGLVETIAYVSCSVSLCNPSEQLTDSMCARPLAAAHL